jgi:hypothetical protein
VDQYTHPLYFTVRDESTAKRVMIVFAYLHQPITILSHVNYIDLSLCKCIFINSGENYWYQTGVPGFSDDFQGTIDKLAAFCAQNYADHEIICWGHSMGAYAAIAAGISLKASRVFASVPEATLRLPGSRSLEPLKGIDVQAGDLRAFLRKNTGTPIDIIVGANDPFDLTQAHEIASFPHTKLWTLPCDHNTLVFLRDKHHLRDLFIAFMRGDDVGIVLDPFQVHEEVH